MALSPLAGKPAPKEMLIDPLQIEREYYSRKPDPADPAQKVAFGTSGYRGSPLTASFNEAHILAITQAICDYRRHRDITGPLYMGRDTHAVSAPAQRTALEVLAGNGVETVMQRGDGFTPTPAISRAILVHNRGRADRLADGIVITPSHNPPEDGGFKYNPPNGGPADSDVTSWIQERANALLHEGNADVKRVPIASAVNAATTHEQDFVASYVEDLRNVVDMEAIGAAGLKLAVDPLGGAAVHYWEPINRVYKLDIAVVNAKVDPTFSFMTVDHDGKIRMDCSSPYAMAGLVGLKDQYEVAFANDADADRHGIVIPSAGLMNPNHYLAVAIRYLLLHRSRWSAAAAVGKTLVSSSLIDRVVAGLGRARVGGAGRVQVVCARVAGWIGLLRWRGERRGELPANGRYRVDHGQGRVDHEPARGRDHGSHRQRPWRALSRTDCRIWRPVLLAYRRARHARAESASREAFSRCGTSVNSRRRVDRGEVHAGAG